MKHTTKMTAVLVALISTTLVFAANAKNRNGADRPQRGIHRGFMTETLELTDAQEKKMDALKKKEQEKVEKIQKDMAALRDKMRAQWENEEVNKKEVTSLQKKMHELKGKIGEARTEFRLGVYDILTKEQRQKAAAEMKLRHAQRQDWQNNNGDCPRKKDGRGDGFGRGGRHGRGGNGSGFGGEPGMGPMW